MFFGQTLVAESVSDGISVLVQDTAVTSPWFDRRGDSALFTIDVSNMSIIAPTSEPQLTVSIETKNTEDLDSAATPVTSMVIGGSGISQVQGTGLKELVRYQYVLTDVGSDPIARTFFVIFRMLDPEWFSN
jgi:hypothetical protein